jgi:hypothetical protein
MDTYYVWTQQPGKRACPIVPDVIFGNGQSLQHIVGVERICNLGSLFWPGVW